MPSGRAIDAAQSGFRLDLAAALSYRKSNSARRDKIEQFWHIAFFETKIYFRGAEFGMRLSVAPVPTGG
jgi:hypothetical protein